jgi:hypothetical protein
MISFLFPKKDFLIALKQLKNPVTVRRNDVFFMRCELIVLTDKVVFKLPGNEIYLEIPTIGLGKTSFYFKDFQMAVQKAEDKIITIAIDRKTIKINKITLSATTEILNKKEANHQLEMPMESLNEVPDYWYASQERKKKEYQRVDGEREFSMYEVDKDVDFVYTRLLKYGFEKSEIQDFINRKIKFSR